MWLAKKLSREKTQASSIGRAADGAVIGGSLPGEGVYCLPYGYYALPQEGSSLLLTQADDQQICCGTLTTPQTQPGEILIKGEGDSYIRLCRDGKIILGGIICREDGSRV